MNTDQYLASEYQRLSNFIIDMAAIMLLWIMSIEVYRMLGLDFSVQVNDPVMLIIPVVTLILFFWSYYIILESWKGQTLGKMITKTEVVNVSGQTATLGQVIIRTLCRCIFPFDYLSYILSDKGLHDRISKTRVTQKY
ncbi:MAG: RDD family protein [Crocinitomicaceae bacterium]